jgi:hypothetical protein
VDNHRKSYSLLSPVPLDEIYRDSISSVQIVSFGTSGRPGVTGNPQKIIDSNPYRIGLMIALDDDVSDYRVLLKPSLSTEGPTTIGLGLMLFHFNPANPTLWGYTGSGMIAIQSTYFSLREHGDIVRRDWWGSFEGAFTGGVDVLVVETLACEHHRQV